MAKVTDFPEWLTWAVIAGGDPYSERVVHGTDLELSAVSARIPGDLELGLVHILVQPNDSGFVVVVVRRERGAMRFRRTMIFLGIASANPGADAFRLNANVQSLAGDFDAWEGNQLSTLDLVVRALRKISCNKKDEGGVIVLGPINKRSRWMQPALRRDLMIAVAVLGIYLMCLLVLALVRF